MILKRGCAEGRLGRRPLRSQYSHWQRKGVTMRVKRNIITELKRNLVVGLVAVSALLSVTAWALACDTWVAMSDATVNGYVMLGKNSDRAPFGCQPLVLNPRAEWEPGSKVDLGRTKVPQVEMTYATLGSSPYWCWGYEEGMNEFGVAIGNEGVWTKPLVEAIEAYADGRGPAVGPTGMDLLRLGLERATSARGALEVMTALLEEYGQFGSGIPTSDALSSYDNSYIIADAAEAYILETAGRRWVARRLEEGSASISNRLSIGTEWDLASGDLVEHAVKMGWWDEAGEFDFRAAYGAAAEDPEDRDTRARVRQERSSSLLQAGHGGISVGSMKEIARDQASEPSIDLDQTASSCVAVLPPPESGIPVFWWCAARPSNGCFIPFFVHGSALPEIVSTAGTMGRRVVPPSEVGADEFSDDSYWWIFRDLTDLVNADRKARQPVVRNEFDSLEAEFEEKLAAVLEEAWALRTSGDAAAAAGVLDTFTASCVERAAGKARELRESLAAEVVEIPEVYRPYVGTYIGNFGHFTDADFEVKIQNGRLAVDVPGQTVFELLEPDEEGNWYFAMTPLVAVSFETAEDGRVSTLVFQQAAEFTREDQPDTASGADVPEAATPREGTTQTAEEALEAGDDDLATEEHRPYIGRYVIGRGIAEMYIASRGGTLVLEMPRNQTEVDLLPPDDRGWWQFAGDDAAAVSFSRDDDGQVIKMYFHQRFELPRRRP